MFFIRIGEFRGRHTKTARFSGQFAFLELSFFQISGVLAAMVGINRVRFIEAVCLTDYQLRTCSAGHA